MESGLRTYLLSKTSVTNLIVDRIYPQRAPQGADFPRITYQRIGSNHVQSLSGASGLFGARVQLDCWGRSQSSVKALAEAVRLVLVGYRGAMGGYTVTSVLLLDQRDGFEPPQDDSDVAKYRVTMDFRVWARETVPSF